MTVTVARIERILTPDTTESCTEGLSQALPNSCQAATAFTAVPQPDRHDRTARDHCPADEEAEISDADTQRRDPSSPKVHHDLGGGTGPAVRS
jgi:hypothetical protein